LLLSLPGLPTLRLVISPSGEALLNVFMLYTSFLLINSDHKSSLPSRCIMKIAIVGLGYVGLPLCMQFARSGVEVLGLDIDRAKVDQINQGKSYIEHIDERSISDLVHGGKLRASTDFTRIQGIEAVIICVPTPLNKNREPDISYILKTGEALGP